MLGSDPKDVAPTVEQMQQMPYLNMVIKEVRKQNFIGKGRVYSYGDIGITY